MHFILYIKRVVFNLKEQFKEKYTEKWLKTLAILCTFDELVRSNQNYAQKSFELNN